MKIKVRSDSIDTLVTNALVLSYFQDEKPLKGSTGMIDWQMNGDLSKLILNRKVSGALCETLLIPPSKKIRAKMILMIGLGSISDYDFEGFRKVSSHIFETIRKLKVTDMAIPLPGIGLKGMSYEQASEIFLKECQHLIESDPNLANQFKFVVVCKKEAIPQIETGIKKILQQWHCKVDLE